MGGTSDKVVLAFLIFLLVTSSCDQQPTVTTTKGTARVECDESLFPVMQFQAEDFHNTYPEGNIGIRSAEAREAIVNFLNDSTRVIAVGRPFNKEELDYLKAANIDYEGYRVAFDAVAVIVNRQRSDSTLRITELDSIFSSATTRWSSGKREPIDTYVGDLNSSTDEVFRTVILNGRPYGRTVTRMKSSDRLLEEVKKNPNAIGVIGVSWLRGHDHEVRVSRVGGGTYRPTIRAKAVIEGVKNSQQRIVITELAQQGDRSAFVATIKRLVDEKVLSSVNDVRDESEGSKVRIVLSLDPRADPDLIVNLLHAHTQVIDTTLVAGQFFSPAAAHVLRKYYPISRDVYMYTREVRRDVGYGFIAYVKDRKGQQNFVNYGLAPATMPVRIVGLTADKVQ